jgi:KUP system potassium uptake protein
MTLALQAAPRIPLPAALAALGIVYGDIGTSPLYALKQAATSGGALSPEAITGIVSLILWSLIMIISVKYAILIMRADNHGEGAIVALLALLAARHAAPKPAAPPFSSLGWSEQHCCTAMVSSRRQSPC